jgi:hypothetical protein
MNAEPHDEDARDDDDERDERIAAAYAGDDNDGDGGGDDGAYGAFNRRRPDDVDDRSNADIRAFFEATGSAGAGSDT